MSPDLGGGGWPVESGGCDRAPNRMPGLGDAAVNEVAQVPRSRTSLRPATSPQLSRLSRWEPRVKAKSRERSERTGR